MFKPEKPWKFGRINKIEIIERDTKIYFYIKHKSSNYASIKISYQTEVITKDNYLDKMLIKIISIF